MLGAIFLTNRYIYFFVNDWPKQIICKLLMMNKIYSVLVILSVTFFSSACIGFKTNTNCKKDAKKVKKMRKSGQLKM